MNTLPIRQASRPTRATQTTRVSLFACLLLLLSTTAQAAGLYLAPRGVRALARGGAFVAGADDGNALSYNPAGLAEARTGLLLDMAMPFHTTKFSRRALPQGGLASSSQGQALGIPSPTGAAVIETFVPGLVVGGAISAPYPLLQNWSDNQTAAQRYAIRDYQGTALTKMSAGFGYAVNEYFSFGAAFRAMVGNFASTVVTPGCDGVICQQPENVDYDTPFQMIAKYMIVPGAHVGALVKPLPWLRIGAAWESEYHINKTADFNISLPQTGAYAGTKLNTDDPRGKVRFKLPMTVRGGIEARLHELWQMRTQVRLEGAFVWENWSVHDRIRVDASNVAIEGLLGLNTYELREMEIQRDFRDTWSTRLGTEVTPLIDGRRPLTLRAGMMYEPAAIPDETLTPMSVDLDKLIFSGGLSYRFRMFVFEATYAYVHMFDKTVTNSRMRQTSPLPDWDRLTSIGNGSYSSAAHLLGLGVGVQL